MTIRRLLGLFLLLWMVINRANGEREREIERVVSSET